MDEIKRFIRFTLPGMAFVIELLIALTFSDISRIKYLLFLSESNKIGLVIGFFLASGGLGYILANIYFVLYWSWPFSKLIAIDHRPIFLNDRINILSKDKNEFNKNEISKRDAWTIATQYWHSQIEYSKIIKGITPMTDRIIDITHGLGANTIGTILSFFTWISVHKFNLSYREIIPIVMWLSLIFLNAIGYLRTLKAAQSIVNSTLTTIILKQPGKTNIYYLK